MRRLPGWAVVIWCLASGGAAQQRPPWEGWQPPAYTPPRPNGYDNLIVAARLFEELGGVDRSAPLEEQQHKLQQLQPVFAQVTAALQLDCLAPQVLNRDQDLKYLGGLRGIARAYLARAAVQAAAGDRAAAAQSDLDAYALGNVIPRGGVLVHLLVGLACQSLATRDLSARVYTLARQDATAALERLRALDAQRVPYSQALAAERVCGLHQLLQTMRPPVASPADAKLFLERNWQPLNETYDQALAQAQRPWPQRGKLQPHGSVYDESLLPWCESCFARFTQSQTETQLLVARLALWLYYCDHDRFPHKLEDLIPTYLPAVPHDFFGDRPLRYQVSPKGCRLWSVAEDGLDQEGTPKAQPGPGEPGDLVDELTP